MANRTSVSIFCRNSQAHLIEDHFADTCESHLPGVTLLNDGEFIPDFGEIIAADIPFYGMHGSHAGDYGACLVAYDGGNLMIHSCDEDGDITLTGLLEYRGDPDDYRLPPDTAEFIAHYQRCRSLVRTDPDSLFPADFEPALQHDPGTFHLVCVEPALIVHALTFFGDPESRVIASFYGGEEALLHLEDIADDREALLADGWPAAFLDFAEKCDSECKTYLRLTT